MRDSATTLRLLIILAAASRSLPARGETPRPVLVWYRSAEGCPEGTAFLARLKERGLTAKLAQVGDAIDFVVTLGNGPDGARGLLERQTETKTVAIRQLGGGTCEQVADAMALSLVVASTPESEQVNAEPESPRTSLPEPALPQHDLAAPGPARADALVKPTPATAPRWGAGFAGGLLLGLSPEPMLASSIFLELDLPSAERFGGLTFRAGAVEAQSVTSGGAPFAVFLAAGRLEACGLRIGSQHAHISPCASIELGTVLSQARGPGGLADHGFWSDLAPGLRFSLRALPPIQIELQAEAVVPLTRYDFVSEARETTYRIAAVGFRTTAGVSVRLP